MKYLQTFHTLTCSDPKHKTGQNKQKQLHNSQGLQISEV